MRTIAIVDDDVYIGDMLAEALTGEGYGVLRAYSGTEALLLLEKSRPDLVLLDLMLPGLSGEQVLGSIRGVPVIVMSAKSDVGGKVGLLLAGAADYITKPFDLRELLARVEVQLRRADTGAADRLECGDISLDGVSRAVTAGGVPLHLTRTEFALLRLLMQNAGHVMARSVILERMGADTPDCVESSLKVHVSNLRRKLREATGRDCIEAVWGIGFRLIS